MKKILRILLAAIMAVMMFSLAACGGGSGTPAGGNWRPEMDESEIDESVTGNLSIRFYKKGFGETWLNNVIDAFNVMYPNVKVDKSSSTEAQVIYGEIIGGRESKYDLYFNESSMSLLQSYSNLCEPLDDVYNYKWNGDEKTIGEKIDSIYRDNYLNPDGHYYNLPSYSAAYGIAYNADILGLEENELPLTTDELVSVCADLKASSIMPFIASGGDSSNYWNFIYSTWMAQYEGIHAYNLAQVGRIVNSDGTDAIDPASAYIEGGLKAMQVCEDILWQPKGYIHTQSTGFSANAAQSRLIQGEVAMMYTGSWMLNEMETMIRRYEIDDTSIYRLMRVPVISAIREKCKTIVDDNELSALIRAIDAGGGALVGEGYDVNQDDYDKVAEARNFVYVGAEAANAVMVKLAPNKANAKLFLNFLYSDYGIRAVAMSKSGCALPVQDAEILSAMGQLEPFMSDTFNALFGLDKMFNRSYGQAVPPYCTASGMNIEKQFASNNGTDRTRAEDSFAAKRTEWTAINNQKFWDEMRRCGYVVS